MQKLTEDVVVTLNKNFYITCIYPGMVGVDAEVQLNKDEVFLVHNSYKEGTVIYFTADSVDDGVTGIETLYIEYFRLAYKNEVKKCRD